MKFSLLILAAVFIHTTNAGVNSKIIGGEHAKIEQHPHQHQVSIQIYRQHRCGGSIITNRWILTAAHCIYRYALDQLKILAGTTNLNNDGELYDVVEGRHHAEWNPSTIENDIALLKTDRPIIYNDRIKPIALNKQLIKPGIRLVMSGWGYTSYPNITAPNRLHFLSLNSIGLEDCKEKSKPYTIFDTQLCTLSPIGEGACVGDSGGPLIHGRVLVGITSWGRPCALGRPDIFTNVVKYLDWINYMINN